MPLTDRLIRDAKERYWREMDRYVKLAEYVHTRCKSIVKDDAIRATTQARAKDPERFEEKLRRYQKDPSKVRLSRQRRHHHVAGWRSCGRQSRYVRREGSRPCSEGHRNQLLRPRRQPERLGREEGWTRQEAFYRATHCQVTIKESELVGTYANLRDLTCEIQVCSLLAHVFNEIEHDLGYKPLAGEISEAETRFLGILAAKLKQAIRLLRVFYQSLPRGDSPQGHLSMTSTTLLPVFVTASLTWPVSLNTLGSYSRS